MSKRGNGEGTISRRKNGGWMAQYYVRTKQTDKAHHYLQWTMDHALPSGALSEQVNPSNGEIVSVTPLVWSHAEFINTALDLAKAN